jgi:carboxymethylenebutenolidase
MKPGAGMRISSLAAIGFLLLASRTNSANQSANSVASDRVVVSSGNLRLTGLLWKPTGPESFPAVLFSHGAGRANPARAEVIGPVFARHGYAFLYLFRRGAGLSAAQGEYMGDVLEREAKARGEEARKRLQLDLLNTDHLNDVMAGLAFLKRASGVDAGRVAVAGHSFGGQLTLLAAERDKDVRAAVTFAAAAQSWDGSPELRKRLLEAVRNIRVPIFLTHAANDFSTEPGQMLAAESARLKRPHELKIYPAIGDTPETGHWAVYTDIASWESDVFRFLDQHVRQH